MRPIWSIMFIISGISFGNENLEKITALHQAEIAMLKSELAQSRACSAIHKTYPFSGKVEALNGLSNAREYFAYKAPKTGTYLIAVHGTASISPVGRSYTVIGGSQKTTDNSADGTVTHEGTFFLQKGTEVKFLASRDGGGGYPSFNLIVHVKCVSLSLR